MPIQRKPDISVPGDAAEREADQVADHIMTSGPASAASGPGAIGTGPVALERKCAACDDDYDNTTLARQAAFDGPENDIDTGAAVRTAASGGAPLSSALRAYFEPRFGHDFSAVRVHADREAAAAARSVQARAYTYRSHVVFAAGEYAPATEQGKRLLAHELTHVVQQGAARSATGTRIDRQAAPPANVCGMREPLYGWDNIRNISRERLRAAGFVFCGPDYWHDPARWEKWVHPTRGILHFQVAWRDDPAPAPAPEPDPPDDRQQRCADPCLEQSDDEDSCKACCEETIPEDDTRCRATCDVACSLML
ncbi:eCIS core domain-containing protein [Massilia frigida]|nr:DUF4157 domain-containing protein [Massilia frigida]